MRIRVLFVLLLPVLLLAACRAENAESATLNIEMAIVPEAPVVGEATIVVSVTDAEGNPINDADVNIVGNMNHAGMNPVVSEASAGENGDYTLPFVFSMGGDWVLTIEVTLADGTMSSRNFEVRGVGNDMGEMEMGTEEAHDMNTMRAVSGAYLSISNNTEADVRLLAVRAVGVGMAEIHQTIVENDMARMEAVEAGLLIAAGETVELAPSGYHVMLMGLEADLFEGETVALTLEFDNGVRLTIDAPIVMDAPEADTPVESAGLSVTGAWVRPTAVMEMATEEAE